MCCSYNDAGREEAVARIRAAVDARSESGSDIIIVARSDARQAESLQARQGLQDSQGQAQAS